LFPWKAVGLVSIPLGFLLGYAGARRSPERDDAKYAAMEVRALTGTGAVAAVALDNRRELPQVGPSGQAADRKRGLRTIGTRPRLENDG
jgi:hypothetical protein